MSCSSCVALAWDDLKYDWSSIFIKTIPAAADFATQGATRLGLRNSMVATKDLKSPLFSAENMADSDEN